MARYPLSLRKLNNGLILSKRVHSPEEEAAHVAEGWSTKVPPLPPAAAPVGDSLAAVLATLTAITERIDAIQGELNELKAKRGPGRPARESK
jgi:hypothetical protein